MWRIQVRLPMWMITCIPALCLPGTVKSRREPCRRSKGGRHAARSPPELERHRTTSRLYTGSGQAGRMLPRLQCPVADKPRCQVVNLRGSEACESGGPFQQVYHSPYPPETLAHAGSMLEHFKKILICKRREMAPERYALLLVAALMLYACTPAAVGKHACSGQQIIITFGPGVDVMSDGFADGLSTDAGMPIEYMRHLFGDHHLYCVQQQLSPTVSMSDALRRLQDRADIQRVEIDRLKQPGAAR